MKLKEVIKELKRIKRVHGNLNVRAYPGFDTLYDLDEWDSIYVDDSKGYGCGYVAIVGKIQPND